MLGAKSRTFAIGNTKMHYVVFGKGEKNLFIIPGLGDGIQDVRKSAKTLAFYYRKFAKQYTVFVCSRKEWLPTGYTTRDMAGDLALFMDAHHIKNAHIMGVSMGGMIAQHLAVDYPHYVEKLIIAVSSSKPNKILNKVVTGWIEMVTEGRYSDFIIDTLERTYTNRYLRKYRPFYFILKKAGKPKSVPNFLRQADACLHHNAHKQLQTITCPTLVVGGGKDEIVGPQASKLIAEQIKDSKFMIYPELGHGAFQESNQFNNDAITFLNRTT